MNKGDGRIELIVHRFFFRNIRTAASSFLGAVIFQMAAQLRLGCERQRFRSMPVAWMERPDGV
jgi:hypothetical protein